MLFSAGACTEGPGMIVTPQLKDRLRSHHDIDRDGAKHFKRASKVLPRYSIDRRKDTELI